MPHEAPAMEISRKCTRVISENPIFTPILRYMIDYDVEKVP